MQMNALKLLKSKTALVLVTCLSMLMLACGNDSKTDRPPTVPFPVVNPTPTPNPHDYTGDLGHVAGDNQGQQYVIRVLNGNPPQVISAEQGASFAFEVATQNSQSNQGMTGTDDIKTICELWDQSTSAQIFRGLCPKEQNGRFIYPIAPQAIANKLNVVGAIYAVRMGANNKEEFAAQPIVWAMQVQNNQNSQIPNQNQNPSQGQYNPGQHAQGQQGLGSNNQQQLGANLLQGILNPLLGGNNQSSNLFNQGVMPGSQQSFGAQQQGTGGLINSPILQNAIQGAIQNKIQGLFN